MIKSIFYGIIVILLISWFGTTIADIQFCDEGDLASTCVINSTQTYNQNITIEGDGSLILTQFGQISCSSSSICTISIRMSSTITLEPSSMITADIISIISNSNITVGGSIVVDGGAAGSTDNSMNGGTCNQDGGQGGGCGAAGGGNAGWGGIGFTCTTNMCSRGMPAAQYVGGSSSGSLDLTFGGQGGNGQCTHCPSTAYGGSGGGIVIIQRNNC